MCWLCRVLLLIGRHSPAEYEDSVRHLLTDALQFRSERRRRIEEGRQLAARWHDKDPTQQHTLSAQQYPSSFSPSQQQLNHQQQRHLLIREPTRSFMPTELSCCVQQRRYPQQLRPLDRSHKLLQLRGSMTDLQPCTSFSLDCDAQGLKPEADYLGQPVCSDTWAAAQIEVICAKTAASAHTFQAARLQQQPWHQALQSPTSRIRSRL